MGVRSYHEMIPKYDSYSEKKVHYNEDEKLKQKKADDCPVFTPGKKK